MSDQAGYIRGGAGVALNFRRLFQVVLAAAVLGLLIAVVVTTVAAAHQNSRQDRLRRHGVPVEVTVSSCIGFGSGIAQAVNYYQCTGTFVLDGHRYAEVIGGQRAQLQAGTPLAAVVIPGDPASVTTSASVAKPGSRFAPYITPIGLGALMVLSAAGLLLLLRRR